MKFETYLKGKIRNREKARNMKEISNSKKNFPCTVSALVSDFEFRISDLDFDFRFVFFSAFLNQKVALSMKVILYCKN